MIGRLELSKENEKYEMYNHSGIQSTIFRYNF